MKLLATCLLGIYLIPAVYQLSVLVDFNIRKDFIAEVLCIERDQPITVCQGTCYLTDQLKKMEPVGDEAQGSSFELKLSISTYTLTCFDIGLAAVWREQEIPDLPFSNLLQDQYASDFFHPPRIS